MRLFHVCLCVWLLLPAKREQDVSAECVHCAQSHHADQPPCAECSLHPCAPDLQGHIPEKVCCQPFILILSLHPSQISFSALHGFYTVLQPELCFGLDSILKLHSSQFHFQIKMGGARIAQLVVLGLAVHSVAGLILLWGHFPVEGIFPLELTWVQTPFPQKLFRMRV